MLLNLLINYYVSRELIYATISTGKYNLKRKMPDLPTCKVCVITEKLQCLKVHFNELILKIGWSLIFRQRLYLHLMPLNVI